MRRYLPSSAVNDPVSAWGLYKSDDDQTHSDDLRCRGGWRGVEPRSRRPRVIRPQAIRSSGAAYSPYPAGYAGRLSPRSRRAGFRSPLDDDEDAPNAQVRPRCRRPVRCSRPTIRAMAARRRPPVYSDRAPPTGPCFRPTIRVMAGPMAPRRSIPIARRRPARSCRRTIRVMAAPTDRRGDLFGSRRRSQPGR